MRIVHLTQSTTAEITGGLEYHIEYLTEALKKRGHEVIVVNTEKFGVRRRLSPATGKRSKNIAWGLFPFGRSPRRSRIMGHHWDALLETLSMFFRRVAGGLFVAPVALYVNGLKPDIVHQHSYLGGVGIWWSLAKRYPIVFTNHTGVYLHLDRRLLTRWLQRQFMKRFTMVIGPSKELMPITENSRYIPNGVDTQKFYPRSSEERRQIAAKYGCEGKCVFLCPRRWAPTKGILYLAKALLMLNQSTIERSVFLFAGNDTPGYERYQDHVWETLRSGSADVRILGNLGHQEMSELMNIARACVFPSLMEATSLACLEAMACGTPVIGTEAGGLAELIRDGVNGWLAPLRDEKALAARIGEVAMLDEDGARRIGGAAFETVREQYTWKAAARRTEEIYECAVRKWTGMQDTRCGKTTG